MFFVILKTKEGGEPPSHPPKRGRTYGPHNSSFITIITFKGGERTAGVGI